MGIGHDYLNYTSWPSSLKIVSEGYGPVPVPDDEQPSFSAEKGDVFKAEVMVRQENVTSEHRSSYVLLGNGENLGFDSWEAESFDWIRSTKTFTEVPADVNMVRLQMRGGGTEDPSVPAVTWYDDLKIYKNDRLIYEDGFASYTPYGVGVGIAVAGVVGTKWLGWW